MTPAALRMHLYGLGMTQTAFAARCGSDPRTVRRWCSAGPVPGPVAALVWELINASDRTTFDP